MMANATPLQRNSLRFPLLNYLELCLLAKNLESTIKGARVDRVSIPQLLENAVGYSKNEWLFDFYLKQDSSESSTQLFISLRSQACTVIPLSSKSMKTASKASRSGFDLALVKHLEGLKVISIRAIENERILELFFGNKSNFKILLLYLIPARPEAILLERSENGATTVLNRSGPDAAFVYPTGRTLDSDLKSKISVRPEYGTALESYSKLYFTARRDFALEARLARLKNFILEKIKYWNKKKQSYESQLEHQNDPNHQESTWNYYGTLLQAQFYTQPKLENGFYSLMDYEKETEIKVPGDPKLNLKQQLEYFFKQAKRAKTRNTEATQRLIAANEKLHELNGLLERMSPEQLSEIEEKLGLTAVGNTTKGAQGFSGKQFQSLEGLTILVGRNSLENIELTFKIARGNDIWLHVKGRPGAHVVIVVPPKKSASLDSLLDAAHLCIFYSGGKDWGKTEVDYTLKKHVKKIKNQSEVSYSANKTLMINPDPLRLKRLLSVSDNF